MSTVKDWRIHLGAHKTATTHLQDTLAASVDDLRARGVCYVPRASMRQMKIKYALPLGRYGWRGHLFGWPVRKRVLGLLDPLRGDAETVVLSEENLLGASIDLLDWPFYRRNLGIVRALNALAGGGAALSLFLSIRSFDGLLPSAYAQMLRVMPIPGGFDPIRRRALDDPPSWTALVEGLATAAPRATLRVWTMEDYRAHAPVAIRALCGVAPDTLVDLPAPRATRAPSAQAIAAIEALPDTTLPQERATIVDRIIADDDSTERFMPFSDAERARLGDIYASDLARLAQRRPNVLLRLETDKAQAA